MCEPPQRERGARREVERTELGTRLPPEPSKGRALRRTRTGASLSVGPPEPLPPGRRPTGKTAYGIRRSSPAEAENLRLGVGRLSHGGTADAPCHGPRGAALRRTSTFVPACRGCSGLARLRGRGALTTLPMVRRDSSGRVLPDKEGRREVAFRCWANRRRQRCSRARRRFADRLRTWT